MKNLSYTDIGKWIDFNRGISKEEEISMGRILSYDNMKKEAKVIAYSEHNHDTPLIKNGNDWKGLVSEVVLYDNITKFTDTEEIPN